MGGRRRSGQQSLANNLFTVRGTYPENTAPPARGRWWRLSGRPIRWPSVMAPPAQGRRWPANSDPLPGARGVLRVLPVLRSSTSEEGRTGGRSWPCGTDPAIRQEAPASDGTNTVTGDYAAATPARGARKVRRICFSIRLTAEGAGRARVYSGFAKPGILQRCEATEQILLPAGGGQWRGDVQMRRTVSRQPAPDVRGNVFTLVRRCAKIGSTVSDGMLFRG